MGCGPRKRTRQRLYTVHDGWAPPLSECILLLYSLHSCWLCDEDATNMQFSNSLARSSLSLCHLAAQVCRVYRHHPYMGPLLSQWDSPAGPDMRLLNLKRSYFKYEVIVPCGSSEKWHTKATVNSGGSALRLAANETSTSPSAACGEQGCSSSAIDSKAACGKATRGKAGWQATRWSAAYTYMWAVGAV